MNYPEPWEMSEDQFRELWNRSAQTAQGIPLPRMNKTDAKNWVGYTGEKSLLVYRGVPAGSERKFRNGDYVTTSEGYAKTYGDVVIKKELPAAHLRYVRGSRHTDTPPYSMENPPPELIYSPRVDSFHKKYHTYEYPLYIKRAMDAGKPVPEAQVEWLKNFLAVTSGYSNLREGVLRVRCGATIDEASEALLCETDLDITQSRFGGKIQWVFKTQIPGVYGKSEIGEITLAPRADGNWEVGNILVWPDYQRQGYATKFYRHAWEHVRKLGKKLYISTDRTPDAKALHRSFETRGILSPDGEITFR